MMFEMAVQRVVEEFISPNLVVDISCWTQRKSNNEIQLRIEEEISLETSSVDLRSSACLI